MDSSDWSEWSCGGKGKLVKQQRQEDQRTQRTQMTQRTQRAQPIQRKLQQGGTQVKVEKVKVEKAPSAKLLREMEKKTYTPTASMFGYRGIRWDKRDQVYRSDIDAGCNASRSSKTAGPKDGQVKLGDGGNLECMGEAAARRWDELAREWRKQWPGRGLHRTYAESTLNFPKVSGWGVYCQASCCFLLLPVASCCFLLLPVAS